MDGWDACARRADGRRGRPGFTLVELLVVIGIIALLIAILLPSLARARDRSNRVKCLANLHSLGEAMYLYAHDFRDRLPNGNLRHDANPVSGDQVLASLNREDMNAPATFHCPSDTDPAPRQITNNYIMTADSARVSYDFFSLYWLPEDGPKLARLRGQGPLAWDLAVSDKPNQMQNHGTQGGNVVYADGHAAWLSTEFWDAMDWPAPARLFYP